MVKWLPLQQMMGRLLDGVDGIFTAILAHEATFNAHERALRELNDQISHHLQQLYRNDMAIRDALNGADENMAIYQKVLGDLQRGDALLAWVDGEVGLHYENGQRPIDWAGYRASYWAVQGLAGFCAGHAAWAERATLPTAPTEPAPDATFDPEAGAAIFGG